MVWNKSDFPHSMKNLEKRVREKSIEIANTLVENEGMDEGKAIPIAISKAKEWSENN